MTYGFPFVNNNNYQIEMQKKYEKRQINKKSSGLGFYIFSYFAVMNVTIIAIMVVLTIFFPKIITNLKISGIPIQLMSMIASIFAAFIPGLFYFVFSKSDMSETIKVNRVKLRILIPIVFMGMAVCMIANVAADILNQNFAFFGLENTLDMDTSSENLAESMFGVVSTALMPAIAEEFAFRGIVLGSLRKYGDTFAIIASAVMFGAMHGNIVQIPFAFILGLVFGFAVCKTNSLIPAIIIHFINNSYAVILSAIQNAKLFDDRTFIMIYFIIVILFCIFGCLAFISVSKKDKDFFTVSDKPTAFGFSNMLTLKDKLKEFFLNAGVIISIGIFAIETIMYIGIINA